MNFFKIVIVCVVLLVLLLSYVVQCYSPGYYSGCNVKVYHQIDDHCRLEIHCPNGMTLKCGKLFSQMGHIPTIEKL